MINQNFTLPIWIIKEIKISYYQQILNQIVRLNLIIRLLQALINIMTIMDIYSQENKCF